MNIKSKAVTLITTVTLSGVAIVAPLVAVADHTTAHTIEQLTAQITALQTQLAALAGATTPAPAAGSGAKCAFSKSLSVGSRGDDVTCLQNYLTGTGHFTYSGGATGYFGGVTKAAVAAWQAANGVSPAVGYFGSISRAKYDSMAVAGGVTPTPTPPGTPPAVPGTPPPVAVGSGLTVSSPAEQPAAATVPEGSARVPYVKAVLTASADGDVKVASLKVMRKGLADDAAFDGILLLDEDGTQIGNSKTLSSEHEVILNESFTVKAGTSKTVTIAGNMATSLDNYAGQLAKLALVSVDAGSAAVNGAFPIDGNNMTLNSTLAIGSVTMSIGSLDPGAANTKNVGTKAYYLASVKASVGSAEDVTFWSLRFNQAGSAASSDLGNVIVKAGDKEYPTTVSSDGKYYVVKFDGGLAVAKGGNLEFAIKSDLNDGSSRTVDMNILRKADIVVKGKVYGYHIVVGGGSAGTPSAGAFSTNQEPFFNAYVATIDKGSMLFSSSNKVTSGNIPVDVNDTVVGAFTFDVKGEPVQVSSLTLNFTFTGTGTSSDVTGVKLFDEAGGIVAGPKDPSSGIVTWTDTWTAPVGAKVYTVKAKLDTSFVANDTMRVGVDGDNVTAKGQVTGLTISPTPTTLVEANSQTIKTAALSVSVSTTPAPQNVVRGVNGFHFATYVLDATASGEDVRLNSIQLRDTVDATTRVDELNTCVLYDGAVALNTGSDVINPDDPASGTTDDTVFNVTNGLVISRGATKKIDLKCNISSSAADASTHAWGTNAAAANIGSVGAQTGSSITESITTATGQLMSIRTAGSFSVLKDASSPVAGLVLSGKTDVSMTVFKYHANDEAINITDATLTFSSTTASTSDFLKATLWDGATKVGEAVWAGSGQFATSTLSAPFVIPKDGDKLLTAKVDLSMISVTASSTAGRVLNIDYNGTSSSSGIGQSSGARLGSGSSGSIQGDAMQIMKTVPTVEKIAIPSTTLPQTDAIMYRFKVTADAAGPLALYKLTFSVSSSSVSATTSNFRVFAYSDAGFSVAAYANNPTHLDNVDCSTLSNLESDTGGCAAVTAGGADTKGANASTTDVVWFFGPVANTSSTTEAVTIPAGLSRYFELRGDITNPGSGTGNNLQVSLLGDAARPVRTSDSTVYKQTGLGGCMDQGKGFLCTAAEVAIQSANNDFVWSPMSTSTSLTGATSTPDWTNGFRVNGLPSTNLSANTFSN